MDVNVAHVLYALQRRIVVVGDSNEDPCVRSVHQIHRQAAVLNCVPGHLKQPPLLRVDGHRLPGRDAEQRGVELVDVISQSGPLGVAPAGFARLGIVK